MTPRRSAAFTSMASSSKRGGVAKAVRVPILRAEHLGPHMAIGEKQLGEEVHTVITNRDTGKVALLANTLKAKELSALAANFGDKAFGVSTITRDLPNGYGWFCREAFPNAGHIADKFHLVKGLMEACQDVRVRYRQEIPRDRRIRFEEHKHREKRRKGQRELEGRRYKERKFTYAEEKTAHGETRLELLARSRFLLFKNQSQWTGKQSQRARALFDLYPEIEKAYKLSGEVRDWYRKASVGVTPCR